jgi:transcriptional regulator with PAS, ATPase and Fis domain
MRAYSGKDLLLPPQRFSHHDPSAARTQEKISPCSSMLSSKSSTSSMPRAIQGVDPGVMHALMQYDWPGNIRELENLMERAYILETTSELTPDSFPVRTVRHRRTPPPTWTTFRSILPEPLQRSGKKGLAEIERLYLKDVLARNKGKDQCLGIRSRCGCTAIEQADAQVPPGQGTFFK